MPASDPTPSAFTDALEIFYAPSEVFERRKLESAFGLPLIILVIGVGLLFFASRGAMDPIFDAEFKRGWAMAIKQNPQLTADMETNARETSRKFVPVFVIGYAFFAPFFLGFFLWLAGKLVGARQELAAACMVGTFALYPRILEGIINAFQALLLPEESLVGRYSVTLGLGRFFNPDTANPLLLALVGRIDLITIWVTVLLAIGLSITGKISRGHAALAAALVWLIGAVFPVIGAIRAMG
jgi:Yip1-like protein